MIFPFAQVGYVIVSCLLRRAIAALQQQIFIDVAGGAHDHHALLLQSFSDSWPVFWPFLQKCSPFLMKIKSSGEFANISSGLPIFGMVWLSTTMPPIYSIESIAWFVGKRWWWWWWHYSIELSRLPEIATTRTMTITHVLAIRFHFNWLFFEGSVIPPKQTIPTP